MRTCFNQKARLYVTVLCASLFACTTFAVEGAEDVHAEDAFWLSTHESVSQTIGQWSNGLDAFFSGHENRAQNQSYVSLRFGPIIGEESSTGFFDFQTRLRLPNTKDRLKLVIESDADTLTQANQTGESSQNSSVTDSAVDTQISAAIRYVKREWNADIDAGVLVDFPLDPFVRMRFRQSGQIGRFDWSQNQSVFSYYSKGEGASYRFGISTPFIGSTRTGFDLGASWLRKDTTYFRQDMYVNQSLNETAKMRYQLSFLQSGDQSPSLDSYLYFVEYQTLLYENWLIGRVKPQITHSESDDFNASASLTLSLEVLLGEEYL
ncbi:hypothetical protein [Marinomonas balearica]|uniref:Salt-induced outer membrane protein YdiY n=1 Tax=Marinomonas balearica TaxID=491947 RepID=A0A4V3CGG8_9GAMM|nr:hypothetical protein [Marinomonas balearica]TDO97602.1 hypothetical protein DFP79_2425 [Marinomonas balearica]